MSMAEIAVEARVSDDSAKCANCAHFLRAEPVGYESHPHGVCQWSSAPLPVTDLTLCSKWERREAG